MRKILRERKVFFKSDRGTEEYALHKGEDDRWHGKSKDISPENNREYLREILMKITDNIIVES